MTTTQQQSCHKGPNAFLLIFMCPINTVLTSPTSNSTFWRKCEWIYTRHLNPYIDVLLKVKPKELLFWKVGIWFSWVFYVGLEWCFFLSLKSQKRTVLKNDFIMKIFILTAKIGVIMLSKSCTNIGFSSITFWVCIKTENICQTSLTALRKAFKKSV